MFPYFHHAARQVSSVLSQTNRNADTLLAEELSALPDFKNRIRLALLTNGIRILLLEYAAWLFSCFVVAEMLKHFGLMKSLWTSLAGVVLMLSQAVIVPWLLAFRPSSDITGHERWLVTSLRYTGLYHNQYPAARAALLEAIEVYQKWSSGFWAVLFLLWGGVFSTFFGSSVHIPIFRKEISPEFFMTLVAAGSGAAIFTCVIFISAPLNWLKSVLRYWPDETD